MKLSSIKTDGTDNFTVRNVIVDEFYIGNFRKRSEWKLDGRFRVKF